MRGIFLEGTNSYIIRGLQDEKIGEASRSSEQSPQFRIYYTHCYLNTHRKLLSSPRPLQSISRAHIIVRPLFSSLQPMFRAYRAYHVYYITIRHKPKQLAAGLLNIATAEIFSGLEEEPLQMSTNFSNFLVYGMKSLKLTALCSTLGLLDARGRVGKKVACSLVVGIHRLPLKGVLPGWRMLLEEKRERDETGTLQSCHHGNVTQWHRACSSLLFSFLFFFETESQRLVLSPRLECKCAEDPVKGMYHVTSEQMDVTLSQQ
ncbi:uncharacterized protein LOC104002116 [Pan troglodytes]|uniref:uncharacterized protein LOC104002116 n=1 Tax=Pan troglodytes TaxID=9598 RepID=UPI0030138491